MRLALLPRPTLRARRKTLLGVAPSYPVSPLWAWG
jgi:hypothetical protein